MELTYKATEESFVRAGLLMMRKRNRRWRFIPILGSVLLVLVIVSIFTNADLRHSSLSLQNLPKLAFAICAPALMASLPRLTRLGFRRQFRKSPVVSETRTLTAHDSGLNFQSASASGRMTWSVYASFAEDADNFLLMQQGNQFFVPIPKGTFTPVQINELRSLFERHLTRK